MSIRMAALFLWLMLFTVLVVSQAVADTSPQDGCRQLRVGVILPLSGPSAAVGAAFRNGIELGLSDHSAQGALALSFEDDGLEPRRSLAALAKLRIEGVDLVVSISSSTSNALAPVLERHGIPCIAVASDAQILRAHREAYLFWNHPEDEARVMFQELFKRGMRKVIRIATTDAWSLSIQEALRSLEAKGAQKVIVEEHEVAPDIRDFSTVISKMTMQRNAHATGVQMILLTPQLGLFARQLRAQGIHLPLFGFSSFADSTAQEDARGALTGSWYVNHVEPAQEFPARYRNRYPGASLYSAAHGYEIARLLTRIAPPRCGKGRFADQLEQALRSPGLFGLLRLDQKRRVRFPLEVYSIP
ncbi:MAG: penicillin-binding protein activator [Bdellovibrionota bacterium]|nr:MAG: penicillin-binding protein activator [Bdellovibrionota bacterium]